MSLPGKLIKMVKKHPMLYDPSHIDYRNNENKDELWLELAKELDGDVMEVKKRWRNLRDTYVKLLKLIKGSGKDPVFEAAATRKYHKWIWTKDMEFFRSYFTYGNQLEIPSVVSFPSPDCSRITTEDGEPPTKKRRPVRNVALQRKIVKRESSSPDWPESPPPPAPATQKVKTKPILSTVKRITVKTKTKKQEEQKNGQSPKSASNLDATDRLFLAHAQTIKEFSARRQALTKLKIAEVIMEQEILHQEDVELASISAATLNNVRRHSNRRDESPPQFETVCGYNSNEDEENEETVLYATKREFNDENPVSLDGIS